MRLSKQLFQERLVVPDNWKNIDTYKLFEACGFVEFLYSGFPTFLPLGQRVMQNIASVIRQEADKNGFSEIYLPLVQDSHFLGSSGRAKVFGNEFMQLKGDLEGYILAPTNEEVFLDMGKRGLESYRQLPVRVYQIADKFRNIRKSKGVLRSRQFLMCDMASMDETEDSLRESAALFESIVASVFSRMQLSPRRIEKNGGKYVDFLIPCREGETRIVIGSDGNSAYSTTDDANSASASSVAMYFIFEEIGDNPTYQSRTGGRKPILLGTYGFGIQRCFHAAVEVYKDDLGINFPESIRPFDVSVLVLDPEDPNQLSKGVEAYGQLIKRNKKAVLDDRYCKTFKEVKI